MNQLHKDENHLFDEYLILSYSRKALEIDLTTLSQSSLKMKEPYVSFVHCILNKISQEMFKVKKQLNERNLKIEFIENDGTFTTFNCYCRGYVQTSRFLNTHLKNKVCEKLNEFFVR